MGKFIGNSDEQFEELANRVDDLTEAHKIMQDTIHTQTAIHTAQSESNYIFNQNFVVVREWLYGVKATSALAIEGEI